MRRFQATECTAGRAWIRGPQAGHLSRVLRMRAGDACEIAHAGRLWAARIRSLDAGCVELDLEEELPAPAPARIELELFPAVIRFHRFEWMLEKAVELGASAITPVLSERVDVHLTQAADKRLSRWQTIARQAAEQARRRDVPVIHTPVSVPELCRPEQADSGQIMIQLNPESSVTLAQLFQNIDERFSRPVRIISGPEGGWSQAEAQALSEAGWMAVRLGQEILRAETAPLAALAYLKLALTS